MLIKPKAKMYFSQVSSLFPVYYPMVVPFLLHPAFFSMCLLLSGVLSVEIVFVVAGLEKADSK